MVQAQDRFGATPSLLAMTLVLGGECTRLGFTFRLH